jgi:hypothetical protein
VADRFHQCSFPACLGPLRYADRGPLERDIAHLSAAIEKAKPSRRQAIADQS